MFLNWILNHETSNIVINFSQNVDINTELPQIFVNKSNVEVSGNWSLSSPNSLTFTPSENWPDGGLVSVQIQDGLTSTDDVLIGLAKGNRYNYIVEAEKTFEYVSYELD